MMQLRGGMMSQDEFFGELRQKLIADANFDSTYSISKLALTSYTEEGQRQYGNIYMRGAVVAGSSTQDPGTFQRDTESRDVIGSSLNNTDHTRRS